MLKWFLGASLALALPAVALAQDAEEGAKIFKKCHACHNIGPDAKNGLGPELTCVIGRPVGSVEGFNYSEKLKAAGFTWDDEHFLKWAEADDKLVPGNKMIFPAGVKDETDRANLLAYVKSQCPAK
jgi:cytochrome c